MKSLARLKNIEKKVYPTLSTAQQAELLDTFIQVETMVRGSQPAPEEIEAERCRLALPIKRVRPEEISAIAEEIKKIIVGHEARKENK